MARGPSVRLHLAVDGTGRDATGRHVLPDSNSRVSVMKRAFSLCAGIALVVLAPAAHARKEFPGVIARELNAPKDPPCSICHLGGKTSGATVFTPFAWTMRAHGLSGSASSVQSAIDGVKADNVDSDGDGVPDWQEIVNGTDPN